MRFSKVWILGVVVLLVGIVVVATAQEKAAEPAKASTASSKSSTSSTGATKLGAKTIIGEVIDPDQFPFKRELVFVK